MLARFGVGGASAAPVVAILTGDEEAKSAYVTERSTSLACRDSNEFSASDSRPDPDWLWYSLRWPELFVWNDGEEFPARDRARLRALVDVVHARGRSLRFWDTPDSEKLWAETIEAGVDMIGTDDLPRLRRFLAPPSQTARAALFGPR